MCHTLGVKSPCQLDLLEGEADSSLLTDAKTTGLIAQTSELFLSHFLRVTLFLDRQPVVDVPFPPFLLANQYAFFLKIDAE